MGIQGLLIGLKPFTTAGHIQEFRGKPIALDTSSWLHKSVYSIADHYVECIEQNGLDRRCINTSAKYITERCKELLFGSGIQRIYLVMDGKRCPLKAGTNDERDARRQENLRQARNFRRQKRHDAMCEKYRSCIKVTEELATKVVRIVQERLAGSVEIIWSPYEADAQLAQLCVDGRAAAVITEDSDVLVYAASCQKVFPIIFKLERKTGKCDILSMDWLLNVDSPPQRSGKDHEVTQLQTILGVLRARQSTKPGWGARLFVQACVLAGCDYAPRQIAGVGLVNAFKMVRNSGCTGSVRNISRVFRHILFSVISVKSRGGLGDLSEFENLLAQSEAVFYYHPVVQRDGTITHLNDTSSGSPYSPSMDRFDDSSFIGVLVANQNDNRIIPESATQKRIHPDSAGHCAASTAAKKQPPFPACTVQNPYKKKPLQNSSPNKQNVFAAYAHRHKRPEEQLRSFKIVTAQLPVRPKEDVRFGKRNFPKDGSRDPDALRKEAEKLRKLKPEDLVSSLRYNENAFGDSKRPPANQRDESPGKTQPDRCHFYEAEFQVPSTGAGRDFQGRTEGDYLYRARSNALSNNGFPMSFAETEHDIENIDQSPAVMEDEIEEVTSPYWRAQPGLQIGTFVGGNSEPKPSTFCYSPNKDEEMAEEADPSLVTRGVPHHDIHRRVTLGVTSHSKHLQFEYYDQPIVQDNSSPVIDLSGEDEYAETMVAAKIPPDRPPRFLEFRVGGSPAKIRPKKKQSSLKKWFLQKRIKKNSLRVGNLNQNPTRQKWSGLVGARRK